MQCSPQNTKPDVTQSFYLGDPMKSPVDSAPAIDFACKLFGCCRDWRRYKTLSGMHPLLPVFLDQTFSAPGFLNEPQLLFVPTGLN